MFRLSMNPKSGKNCVDDLSDSSPIWDIEASPRGDGANQLEIVIARGVIAMLGGIFVVRWMNSRLNSSMVRLVGCPRGVIS